jgi:excisionase family DNA binding protein
MENTQHAAWISRREAAQLLSIDLATLDRWATAGTIQRYRLAGRVWFRAEDVTALAQPRPVGEHPLITLLRTARTRGDLDPAEAEILARAEQVLARSA